MVCIYIKNLFNYCTSIMSQLFRNFEFLVAKPLSSAKMLFRKSESPITKLLQVQLKCLLT